jgi:hypothetical protein
MPSGEPKPGESKRLFTKHVQFALPFAFYRVRAVNHPKPLRKKIECRGGEAPRAVRGLELSAPGTSVTFAMPHGKQPTAREQYGNRNIRLAEPTKLVQQTPLSFNQKLLHLPSGRTGEGTGHVCDSGVDNRPVPNDS